MGNSQAVPKGLLSTSEREAALLAPYAMHSSHSLGRKHPEPEHPYRGPYQRDRDRILHSSAFRRLSGKTQVFTGEMGDYHRTRLTHTFEVASIARTMSRSLRLNEDLVEALALFHDVGHPPFGHAGEDALHECLSDFGGFSHNSHALTLAEQLEQRYPQFPGLNLTAEVLSSQFSRSDKSGDRPQPLLEAQVVDAADSITYDAHDTDDAVKVGLLTLDQLAEIPLIQRMLRRVRDQFTGLTGDLLRKAVVHELIDFQVSDLLRTSSSQLAAIGLQNAEEMRESAFYMLPSPEIAREKRELEQFLYVNVYRHPQLLAVRSQAQHRLRRAFDYFVRQIDRLPPRFRDRVPVVGTERSVGEYLAGMTDRFFDQEYLRLRIDDLGG